MTEERTLTDGSPVPADGSHREIQANGMQKGYVVLSEAERAKGFVKPVRRDYRHNRCGGVTTMSQEIAETYARNPSFYSGTFCVTCRDHFPLAQFTWMDGEPMDPAAQAEAKAVEETAQEQAGELKSQARDKQLADRQAVLDDERARAKAEHAQREAQTARDDSNKDRLA